jgi:hypothetical protein
MNNSCKERRLANVETNVVVEARVYISLEIVDPGVNVVKCEDSVVVVSDMINFDVRRDL